jgi:hypothetical protein
VVGARLAVGVGLIQTAVRAVDTEPITPGRRPRERRFRVYNVGIAKTGTQSVAGIFANYRALHEYLFADTVEAIGRRSAGEMSDGAFREFIRWRDGVARLDVDSSSYNSFYADVLADEFADARFIFVIRDCWSWLDSMLNMVLHTGAFMPEWMTEHCRTILGPRYAPELGEDAVELARRLPGLVTAGLDYWARANWFVLSALPRERSIVVRTNELSESLPRLADFVGVPLDTLRSDLRHVHRGTRRFHALQAVGGDVLRGAYTRAGCAGLMQRFFPEAASALP